jgi:glycerol-3-phosphate dehydrogenase (NAD(P)+)
MTNVSVFGAGAWGTALASHAAGRHAVCLWARDATQASAMVAQRENRRYLAGQALSPALHITPDFEAAVAHARGGLAVIATPMGALRDMLRALPRTLPVVWLCKGFEADSGDLGHEIARQVRGGTTDAAAAVLSGPSFAVEVARGAATALVAASGDPALAARVAEVFHHDSLRVYTSADPVGVEVGGAVKNVLAIATGILDGLAADTAATAEGAKNWSPASDLAAPGLNARAALITRGLAEMTRLGVALGARAETFMGLSGLGDLVLTATGALSRNRQVGILLASGRTLPEVLAGLGHVAEGVYSAATVVRRAQAMGVEMPIAEAVVDVLASRLHPAEAVARLMARQARPE